MEKIIDLNVAQLAEKMDGKDISAREAAGAYLEHISKTGDDTGAYLRVTEKEALAKADETDRRRMMGEAMATLAGVPAGYKDNICTEGVETTCASKMLAGFVPPYSAAVKQRLDRDGVVMLGKLNMDEFAMGSSNETSAYFPVKNPRDPARVPGGSSGGSAAAVAAKQAAFALGTDTGGSIRLPAAFCGVVGVKPTYGSVSRSGVVAFASSLDQVGTLTRGVEDAALVLEAICAHDKNDSTSVPGPRPAYTEGLKTGAKGLKIGMPKELFGEGISPDVKEAVLASARAFEGMGAAVEEVSMPALQNALPSYYVISCAEASSNLARFDGLHYGYRADTFENLEELYKNTRTTGFGAEVKRRILLGTFVLSAGYYDAYYKKAQQVRTLIIEEFSRAFEKYDLLLTPTTPTVAYKFGEKSEPMQMYMGDACTVPVNVAGLPALSMPCGSGEGGMPVGLQLIAKAFDEPTMLRAAYALETQGEVAYHG